ncbi:hypothetical protein T06_1292 [Trichinella sp. T6]|nr:hypothetical protein T06_1292 [Trichinella sp. T6]
MMNSKEFNEMIVFLMIPNVRMVYDRLSDFMRIAYRIETTVFNLFEMAKNEGKSSCPKRRNIEQECAK